MSDITTVNAYILIGVSLWARSVGTSNTALIPAAIGLASLYLQSTSNTQANTALIALGAGALLKPFLTGVNGSDHVRVLRTGIMLASSLYTVAVRTGFV